MVIRKVAPTSIDEYIAAALRPFAGPKGNLKFPLDRPIPYDLIKRVVLLRVRQVSGRAAARRRKP